MPGQNERWWVEITYELDFPYWENAAWVREAIEVRGPSAAGSTLTALVKMETSPFQLEPPKDAKLIDGERYRLARKAPNLRAGPPDADESANDYVVCHAPQGGLDLDWLKQTLVVVVSVVPVAPDGDTATAGGQP